MRGGADVVAAGAAGAGFGGWAGGGVAGVSTDGVCTFSAGGSTTGAGAGGGAVVVDDCTGGLVRVAVGVAEAAERAAAGRAAPPRDPFISAMRSFTRSTTSSSRLAMWFFTSTPNPWTMSMSSCGESFRSRAS
ncbi:MAG: hypothetical protein R3E97_10280 [Candidatus Eisenbacteria bacterium]